MDDTPKCEGKSQAWGAKFRNEPHNCYQPHPPCMRCYADMGCVRCSGRTDELLCRKCKDWAHPAAFEKHGRMLKTPEERRAALAILRGFTSRIGN
jgi:hypothetical protein